MALKHNPHPRESPEDIPLCEYINPGTFRTPALVKLMSLREAVLIEKFPSQRLIDRHDNLVMAAYELQMSRLARELLLNGLYATDKTRKLWKNIRLIGRLRVAFWEFLGSYLKLPIFTKVNIIPVTCTTISENALRNPINLRQAFDFLGLPLNMSTIQKSL